MKVLTCVFLCVFACLWIKVNADCKYTHRGLRAKNVIKTGTTLTDNCMLYECKEKGEWTWTACPEWVDCEVFEGFQPYNYSLPYPDCCGGPVCKTSFTYQTAVSSISKDEGRPNEPSYNRHAYPVIVNSSTILSAIESLVISFVFFLVMQ